MISSEILEKINLVFTEQERKILLRNLLNNEILQELFDDNDLKDYLLNNNPSLQKFNPINICQYLLDHDKGDLTYGQSQSISIDSEKIINKSIDAYQRLILQNSFLPAITDAYLISLFFAQKFNEKSPEKEFFTLFDPEKIATKKNQFLDWIFACLVNNSKQPWVLFQQVLCKYPIDNYIEALINGLIFNFLQDEEIEKASIEILENQNISLCNQYLAILRKKGLMQSCTRIAQVLLNSQAKYHNDYAAFQQSKNKLNWKNIGKLIEFLKNLGLLYYFAGKNCESVVFYQEAEELLHLQKDMLYQLIGETDSIDIKTAKNNETVSLSHENKLNNTSEYNPGINSLPVVPYKKINALVLQNKYKEAEKIIKEYLSEGTSDPILFTISAKIDLLLGGYRQALTKLRIANSIDANNVENRKTLAEVYFLLGDYKQAYETFLLTQLDGEQPTIKDFGPACNYLLRSGQPQLAILKIENNFKEKNIPHELLLTASEAAIMIDDYEKASGYLQRAITEKNDHPRSWILLSNLYKKKGQNEKSIEALFTGLKYCPRSQVLLMELAKYSYQLGNLPQAKKYINELMDLPLESLEVVLDISQFLIKCDEIESARMLLEKAIIIWPKSQSLIIDLSRILINQKEYSSAIIIWEKASDEFPLDYDGLKLFILSMFRSSEELFPISSVLEQAQEEKLNKAISNLISLFPEDAWGKLFKAVLFTLKADYSKAYDILSDYIAQPEIEAVGMTWRYLLALGQVMVEIGKPETAITLFEEVNEKKPDVIEIKIYLAETFKTLGFNEKAFEISWNAIQHSERGGKYINWMSRFLFKIGKSDFVAEQIKQKLTKQNVSVRELLLLGFLLFNQNDSNRIDDLLYKLISSKMNQDEMIQYLILLIWNHDYMRANDILQDNQLLKVGNNRKINLIRACVDYYHENLSDCKKNLLENINKFESSNLEKIFLNDVIFRNSSREELEKFLNERTVAELVNEYQEASQEFEDLEEIGEIFPENWVRLIVFPEKFIQLVLENFSKINNLQSADIFLDHFISQSKCNMSVYEIAVDFWKNLLNFEKAHQIITLAKGKNKDGIQNIPISLKYIEIELLLGSGDELKAASLLNEVIKQDKENPRLSAIQSRILLRQSDYENSIKCYEKAKKSLSQYESWILDAALEIGDHAEFITFTQKIIESQSITPNLLCKLLQEKAELFKLNYQLNEFKSVNKKSQHQIKIGELVSKYSDEISGAIKLHPEIALWNSINHSLDNNEKVIIQFSSRDTRAIHMVAFIYRINKNKKELENLLKDNQADAEINFQMAMLLLEDDPEQSRQYFKNAIARNPRNPLYYAGLSYLEMKNANYVEALQLVEQALQFVPNEIEWQKLAMNAAELINKWDKVIYYGKTVIFSNPNDFQSAKKLLHAYLKKGDVLSAEKLIQEKKFIDNESFEVMIAMGKAALINKKFDKAIDYAHQANKTDSKAADPFVLLSEIYLELRQYNKAFEYAQNAFELEPDQIKSQLVLASAIQHTRSIEAAIEFLKSIIEKGNHSPVIYTIIADLIKKKDGVEQALQYLQFCHAQPNDMILNQIAHYEFELNKDDQAAEQARLSLQQNPNQPDLIQLLGKIAEKAGNLDQAIKYFFDAISLNPTEPANFIAASNIFLKRREFLKALEVLENGLKQSIDKWQLYQQAGKIYWDGKDFKKAEDYFHLAHQLNPSDTQLKRQLDILMTMNILNTQQEARI